MPPVDPDEVELISTKTQAPRVPPSLVVRTSLIDRLSDGIGPVILVRAPAGYGKSPGPSKLSLL